ncbi:PorP/SprF family type IX secretion system membrane protein [Aureibaculum conchae]|uniref:PorP/SprF family type IX secretion system membrane protein n=1 Tax=Aureibaculum sp. 2308TA14-22 TaxID=3108392 RepID=UPI003392D7CD
MISNYKIQLLCFVFSITFMLVKAQGTLPVYTDYLSDNVFLLHPSAAGIGNCAKLRLTHRQQWSGVSESPALQTLSYHQRIGESVGLGGVIFNDKNGYHAQKGISITYAYHVNFGREQALNQLSLALTGAFVQNSVDGSDFVSIIPDVALSEIIKSDSYYNTDFSIGYHYIDAFSYLTIKNVLLQTNKSKNYNYKSLNLRRYLFTLGYYWGRNNGVQFEPSIMLQLIERTSELSMDINLKAYKKIGDYKQIWAGLSYRNSMEENVIENLKQLTPIIGFDYKRFQFSYTYTKQFGNIVLDNNGHHQITLGVNLFCTPQRAKGCPNINGQF